MIMAQAQELTMRVYMNDDTFTAQTGVVLAKVCKVRNKSVWSLWIKGIGYCSDYETKREATESAEAEIEAMLQEYGINVEFIEE